MYKKALRLLCIFLILSITCFSQSQFRFQKKIILPDSLNLVKNSGVIDHSWNFDEFYLGFNTYKETGTNERQSVPLIIKYNYCLKKQYSKTYNKPNTEKSNHLLSNKGLNIWHYKKNVYFTHNWIDKNTDSIFSTFNKINSQGKLKFSKRQPVNNINKLKGYKYRIGNNHTNDGNPDSIVSMMNVPGKKDPVNGYEPPKHVSQKVFNRKTNQVVLSRKFKSAGKRNFLSLSDFDHNNSYKTTNGLTVAFRDSGANNVMAGFSLLDTSWVKRFYVPSDSAFNIEINHISYLDSNNYFFAGNYSKPGAEEHKIVGFFDTLGNPKNTKIIKPRANKKLIFNESLRIGQTYADSVAVCGALKDQQTNEKSGIILIINDLGKIIESRKYPSTTYLSDIITYSVKSLMTVGGNDTNAFLLKLNNQNKTGCISSRFKVSSQKLNVKDSSLSISINKGNNFKEHALKQNDKNTGIIDQCTNTPPTAGLPDDTFTCSQFDQLALNAKYFKGKPVNKNCSFKWNTGETTAKKQITKPGKYWVTIKFGSCKDSDTINVEAPQVTYKGIKSGDTVCKSGPKLVKIKTKSIKDSSKLNVVWETPKGKKYNQDSLFAKDSGKYYLRASYKGCQFLDSFRLNKYSENFTLNLNQDTVLCSQDTLKLDLKHSNGQKVNQGADYKWKNGDTVPTKTITNRGKYWVTVSKNGCSLSDTTHVYYPKLNIQTFPNKDKICPYDSILGKPETIGFKNKPSSGFQWTLPDNSKIQRDSLMMIQKGKYRLSLPGHRCSLSDTFTLYHYPLPEANATLDSTMCYGDSLKIHAKGGVTYKWKPPEHLNNPNKEKPIATPPDTQLYYFITSNKHGCSDTDRVKVNVRAPLKSKMVANKNSLCQGDTLTLKAKNVDGGFAPDRTITWYKKNSQNLGNGKTKDIAIDSVMANKSQSHAFIMKLSDDCSLPFRDTLSIETDPKPHVSVTANPLKGCSPLKTTFRQHNELPSGYTFTWLFPYHPNISKNKVARTFKTHSTRRKISFGYKTTSKSGCEWQVESFDTVTVSPLPSVKFKPEPDSTSIKKPLINFKNLSKNAVSFQWHFGDGEKSYQKDPSHSYDSARNYLVKLLGTNQFGCEDSFLKKVKIFPVLNLYLPNAFSPNKDGLNEVFKPIGTAIKGYKLTIYNRWGAKIFQGKNRGWDGTYNGQKATAGAYFYTLYATGNFGKPIQKDGMVQLIR